MKSFAHFSILVIVLMSILATTFFPRVECRPNVISGGVIDYPPVTTTKAATTTTTKKRGPPIEKGGASLDNIGVPIKIF